MADTTKPTKQKKMDETLEDSFPASDPPSWSSPKPDEAPQDALKQTHQETKGRPQEQHKEFSKEDFTGGKD